MEVSFNKSVIFIYALLIVSLAGIVGGGKISVYANYTLNERVSLSPKVEDDSLRFNTMTTNEGQEVQFKLHSKNDNGTITLEKLRDKSLWKSEAIGFILNVIGTCTNCGVTKMFEFSDISDEGYFRSSWGATIYQTTSLGFRFIGYTYPATKLKFKVNPNYKVTFNGMSLEQFNQNLRGISVDTVVQVKIHNKLISNLVLKLSQNNISHLQQNGSQEEFNLFNVRINSNDGFTEQKLTINSNFNYNTYSNSLQRVRLTKEFNVR